MSKLQIAIHLTEYTIEKVLKVYDKAILMIPEDQLDFRPTAANMTAKEISYHVYQVAFCFTKGTEKGSFEASDFQAIPFDPDKVTDPSQIVDFGLAVKSYMRTAIKDFTEDHMTREIEFYFGRKSNGFDSMMMIPEEAIHHRGQLQIYLRLMGIKPPYLYDHSD